MDTPGKNKVALSQLDLEELRLGSSNREFELETRDDARRVAQALVAQAQHTLLLHTEDLEPMVYDRQAFIDAVSRLATTHRNARIWILVQEPRKVVQHGHRLVELSRRLNTFVQFRRPCSDYRSFHETFLLADNCGYLHRRNPNRYEGTANFHDPGKATDWVKYFMEVWERSEPDEELKRLHL